MNKYLLTITLNSMTIGSVELDKDEVTIGRDPYNDVVIDNPATSRYHATIYKDNGRYIIEDLKSSNGTFVNNFVINKKILEVGDEILIGKHILKINPLKPQGAVLDLAFQSESQHTSADEGTFVVDEMGRRKILNKIQHSKFKKSPFVILQDNRKIHIRDSFFNIGRAKGNNLKIKGFFIKNLHAQIVKITPGRYKLISHGNFLSPVKINGKTVREHILKNGDLLHFGKTCIVFYES